LWKAAFENAPESERTDSSLEEVAKSSDPSFRMHLMMQMSSFKDARVDHFLKMTVADTHTDGMSQLSAAWSLALRHDPSGKERALKSVVTADQWRDFGMQTLAILKATDTIPTLENCMNSSSPLISESCALGKLRVELSINDASSRLKTLEAGFRKESSFPVRAWVARELAKDGSKGAFDVLCRALTRNPEDPNALNGLREGVSKGGWDRDQMASCLKSE
jgi:hypothetical protein